MTKGGSPRVKVLSAGTAAYCVKKESARTHALISIKITLDKCAGSPLHLYASYYPADMICVFSAATLNFSHNILPQPLELCPAAESRCVGALLNSSFASRAALDTCLKNAYERMRQASKQRTSTITVYEHSSPEALEAVRILRREYTSKRGLTSVVVRLINNYLASGAVEKYNDLLLRRIFATIWDFRLSGLPEQYKIYQQFAQLLAPSDDPSNASPCASADIDELAKRFSAETSDFHF